MNIEDVVYLGVTALLSLALVATASSYGAFSIVVIILAILTIIMNLAINYADFILFPLFTSVLRITIIPGRNFIIPKDQKSVIKYTNGLYYATGYLTANIYNYIFAAENPEANEEANLASSSEKWERLLMSIDFPFRFNVITAAQDIQSYRSDLEGQRGFLEFQLSKEMKSQNANQMTIEDLQRRISIVQTRIERISAGERPVNSLMYIETTAVGVSEKEAVDSMENQINELQTVFNSFDLNIMRIVGRELYYMYKFNYALPEKKELSKIFQTQK